MVVELKTEQTAVAPTIELTIDGQMVCAKQGATILEAAQKAGIYIPTLCHHPALKPFATCRMCIVAVEGALDLLTACNTPAKDGMVVSTNSPQTAELRRDILRSFLRDSRYPLHYLQDGRRTELQRLVEYVGLKDIQLSYTPKNLPVEKGGAFFIRDYNRCIVCGRCVRICNEVRGRTAIIFSYRDGQPSVGTPGNRPLEETPCEFCGACVDACPSGALSDHIEQEGMPDRFVRTTCIYCGVGCQLILELNGDRLIRVTPDPRGAANRGQACVKGRFGIAQFVHHPERLTKPLIKRNGRFEEASWNEALGLIAERLSGYKSEEIAIISSAKCTNEENYILQKLARTVLHTNSIDHCARHCHAPTVSGLVQSFGSGAATNTIQEIGDAACIFIIGSDTSEAHPVLGLEVIRAIRHGAKLIVANPRQIRLSLFADLWLSHRPGTDVALLMGMMRVIADEGLLDSAFIQERCDNFHLFRESLKGFDLDYVEQITGVPREKVIAAARMYATTKPACILYAMGITQHAHGTDNVLAIANLAMLTGNVGTPSSGVYPLRGHNNVQGSCDMGALPNYLPGYQSVFDSAIRQKFGAAWGYPLNDAPGLTFEEILDGASLGSIKALYLMGGNLVLSSPSVQRARQSLLDAEFVVAQDIFLSETAQLAHVVLPSASFVEKDGTFTNTERRVQLVRKAIEPIGQSRPDWWIVCQIAKRLGGKGFDFEHPGEIMEEIARVTPSYGGISYKRLEFGGLQWPCPIPDHPGTPILHTEKFTRGRGRFIPLEYKPPLEMPDENYPLILTSERSLYHFHTGTMTRRVEGLNLLKSEEFVEISPQDAQALGIADGEWVRVISRRGQVEVRARVTETAPLGVVSMSFHFAESPINILTNPAIDPASKIPEFKVCAVRIERDGVAHG